MKDKNKKIVIFIIFLMLVIVFSILMGYFVYQTTSNNNVEEHNQEEIPINDKIDKGEEEIEYTVVFDSNGGSFVNSIKVKEETSVSKPEDPVRDGYTFINWTLDDNEYDFNTTITKDIVLKANWEKEKTSETTTKPSNNTNKKAESTIDKINLNDFPTTSVDYRNFTQPISYYFITNLEEVFPDLAGKTYITLCWEEEDPQKVNVDMKANDWYASFSKLKFDTAKENKAKELIADINNKTYKGIKFYSSTGSTYMDTFANINYSEDHGISYRYEYLMVPKSPLQTLYNGLNNVRISLNSEIGKALDGSIEVVYPGYGVYGKYETGILTEEMCKEYNLVCDRW